MIRNVFRKIASKRKFIMPLPRQSNMPQTSMETRPNYFRDLIMFYTGGCEPRLCLSQPKVNMTRRLVLLNHYIFYKMKELGGMETLCKY